MGQLLKAEAPVSIFIKKKQPTKTSKTLPQIMFNRSTQLHYLGDAPLASSNQNKPMSCTSQSYA